MFISIVFIACQNVPVPRSQVKSPRSRPIPRSRMRGRRVSGGEVTRELGSWIK